MIYKCIKEMCLPKCDGDGFEIPNEYGFVAIGSIWEKDSKTSIVGGDVHLDSVDPKQDFGWIEITAAEFEKNFVQIGRESEREMKMSSKIQEAKLKTLNMFNDLDHNDPDYPLWERISAYMNEEVVWVIESSMGDGTYVFLGLKDKEKDREVHYMMEQDSWFGVYIDDREEFDKDWDSGNYEPDGCYYLNPENVELLENGVQRNV